ncbi:amidase substrates transport protein [Rhodococcus sp. MH15]|uniref:AmiS/UreI family transporter n=1 Tax=unclassified Rhodococcus (in: high G+C Gram-positive bacteria) TaxID=192944 RepID=UPI000717EC45|nr:MULTISPECIES: AmiS/UreI family transporter [unclassified Rhodococcus (in: high G+C Gram-positive bacteria)]MBW0294645.1 amidase substrates transport protein [Rhodococcus sp. MH15]
MVPVALLFVGAVLLVNGLVFLDRVTPKSAVAINLLTGALLVGTALVLVLPSDSASPDGLASAVAAGGFALFGFTYLTVATNSISSAPGSGLGWYCGWASAVALFLSMVHFLQIGDAQLAWLWLAWAVLFAAFFLALATPAAEWIGKATGMLAVLQSISTASIPAALMLTDKWADTPVLAIAGTQIVVVIVYVFQVADARRRYRSTATRHRAPATIAN